MLVSHRMNIIDPEGHPIHLVKAVFPRYLADRALVQSNVDLVKRVLSRPAHCPRMIRVKASQKTLGASYLRQFDYASGISVDIADGMIEVHALTAEAAQNS